MDNYSCIFFQGPDRVPFFPAQIVFFFFLWVGNCEVFPPPATTLIEHFKIIYASPELINLKIAEAITIKTTKPIINVKYNELYDFLKLF